MNDDSSRTDNSALLEQPFVSHLLELRDRLLKAVMAIGVFFLCLFYFANDIYLFVAAPLMAHLPQGSTMIATEVASPFLTPFKLTLMVSVFLSMPFILFQLWAFIAPGLYKHEKKMVMPLVISSTILYYVGMAFAYYVVFPLVFAFLIGTTPDGITVATDIAKYLDFVLTLFFAFGVAFEVPIATILLVWMGMTTPEKLREKRPYVVVGAFVVGMFLTPPDVISQTLLALPMWLLYEVGIIFSKAFVRTDKPDYSESDDPDPTPSPSPVSPAPSPAHDKAKNADVPAAASYQSNPDDDFLHNSIDPERYTPLTPEELDRELDMIEEEESKPATEPATSKPNSVDNSIPGKFYKVQQLRDREDDLGARELLYEILTEGDDDQRNTARNILKQLDE